MGNLLLIPQGLSAQSLVQRSERELKNLEPNGEPF